jgi:hypothetical protein
MAKAIFGGLMEKNILVISSKISVTVMESLSGRMVVNMKVSGSKANSME